MDLEAPFLLFVIAFGDYRMNSIGAIYTVLLRKGRGMYLGLRGTFHRKPVLGIIIDIVVIMSKRR